MVVEMIRLSEAQRLADLALRLEKALKGMMEIAELAMPDSFFQTDRRVKKARRVLAEIAKMKESR